MKSETYKSRDIRGKGDCPYTQKHCHHAKTCLLGKQEACAALVANRVGNCTACRRKNGTVNGNCRWQCFRFVKGLT